MSATPIAASAIIISIVKYVVLLTASDSLSLINGSCGKRL
jgi:hypothetical protein